MLHISLQTSAPISQRSFSKVIILRIIFVIYLVRYTVISNTFINAMRLVSIVLQYAGMCYSLMGDLEKVVDNKSI